MAMVDVGVSLWPPMLYSASIANMLLDAADEVAGQIFRIRTAGTIVRAHWLTGTVTTGGTDNLDVRLETVDGGGLATGTLFGTNTNIAHDLADTDDNIWIRSGAFTGSATVAVGDLLALVVVNPAANFGTWNARQVSLGALSTGMPHAFGPTRATKIDTNYMLCALEYDDGTFAVPIGCYPYSSVNNSLAVNTGTNPDEVGVIFTPQFDARVIGWWLVAQLAATADYRVNLYVVGNDTPVLTKDYDGDVISSAGGARTIWEFFGGNYSLAAGTQYRLGFLPTTAASVTIRYDEVSSSYLNLWDQFPGKQAMHYIARNRSGTSDPDAAAWTATTNRRMRAGLIYDQIDDGAGSGAGTGTAATAGGVLIGGGLVL